MAKARILLVDDEPDLRRIGELSLRRIGGFEVLLAETGEEALAILAREPRGSVDLVLLDAMMPQLDGEDTLRALRASPATASLPVVFLTAKVQPEDVARYLALGASGVIAKPFDATTLPHDVARYLAART